MSLVPCQPADLMFTYFYHQQLNELEKSTGISGKIIANGRQ